MKAAVGDAGARALAEVERALHGREPIFHRAEHGTTRADFEAMIEPDFWEVGASGRIYTRAVVLAMLDERFRKPQPDPWEVRDFACREIALDNYLATYTLLQDERESRRATLWRRHGASFRAVYHQGTLVDSGARGRSRPAQGGPEQ